MVSEQGGLRLAGRSVRVEHEVKLTDFTKWLGGSPRDSIEQIAAKWSIVFAAHFHSFHIGLQFLDAQGARKSRSDAERSAAELVPLEIPRARINILTPEVTEKEIATLPDETGEQPGTGKAMGAAVGAAMGVASGVGLGPAIASLLVPGVGPVLGMGILAGTLLGAIGAVSGYKLGGALESESSEGLPEDELFIYEDALRKGRTVVVVIAEDDDANAVRGALELAGAESIDRAREMWWLGLRDVEKERYTAEGANFEHDEPAFRGGFEAALQLRNRNRSYEDCYQELAERDARVYESEVFRRGYERGLQYLEALNRHAGKTAG